MTRSKKALDKEALAIAEKTKGKPNKRLAKSNKAEPGATVKQALGKKK